MFVFNDESCSNNDVIFIFYDDFNDILTHVRTGKKSNVTAGISYIYKLFDMHSVGHFR